MKHIISILLLLFLFIACNSKAEKKDEAKLKIGQTTASNASQSDLEKSMARGQMVYKDFCNQCHRPKGKGIGRSFPPLAGSDYLKNNRLESIRGVKFGQKGEIVVNGKTYNGVMAPMGLSNEEVADVMNYIMNTWGNEQAEMVTVEEVASIEKE